MALAVLQLLPHWTLQSIKPLYTIILIFWYFILSYCLLSHSGFLRLAVVLERLMNSICGSLVGSQARLESILQLLKTLLIRNCGFFLFLGNLNVFNVLAVGSSIRFLSSLFLLLCRLIPGQICQLQCSKLLFITILIIFKQDRRFIINIYMVFKLFFFIKFLDINFYHLNFFLFWITALNSLINET